jgi:hypothetical protein
MTLIDEKEFLNIPPYLAEAFPIVLNIKKNPDKKN